MHLKNFCISKATKKSNSEGREIILSNTVLALVQINNSDGVNAVFLANDLKDRARIDNDHRASSSRIIFRKSALSGTSCVIGIGDNFSILENNAFRFPG